jgi:hypothetical protein
VKTAAYLRRAILETMGLESTLLERALGSKYCEPRGPLILVRYVRGTLIGSAEQLAAEGEQYPMFHWQGGLQMVRIGEESVYEFTPKDTVTGSFGPGVQMTHVRYEVWDGSKMHKQRVTNRLDAEKSI